MKTRQLSILVIVASFLTPLLVTSSASAHTATGSTGFYEYKWYADPDLTLPWRFVSNFPGGNDRDMILQGAGAWDALGQPLQWGGNNTPDYSDFAASNGCAQPRRKNSIQWEDITSPGRVYPCLYTDGTTKKIWNVQMVLDSSGPNWHKSTSTPSSGETDMLSVAVHEWGHMSGSLRGTAANESDGQGHFGEQYATPCPGEGLLGQDNDSRETLCPQAGSGTVYARTLSNHDEHTFQAAY